ncbi:Putative ribonuclease H-like superfamily [Septoria linicola]|uniref:Ribonuclease H-like superfamily n=1 Tax=Septoria linicola TaxID=215465 RepID=A0A9Q9EFV9_9PEZI|nr:putative ribonuclease H-like superfamily [Septoria linicola]USW48284.1 Putative ribonuclease H-like superfamily [Septoria linicola]
MPDHGFRSSTPLITVLKSIDIYVRNGRFSKGNPDSFAFGESAGLTLADANAVLATVIENGGLAVKPAEPRNVIIVGHSLKNDLAYLRLLGGLEVLQLPNVVLRFDTQLIATPKKQKPGLAKLLVALEIDAKHLHNAGNDAYYTLYALLCMAVKERHEPGSVVASLPQPTRLPKKRYNPQRHGRKDGKPPRASDTMASHASSLGQASAGARPSNYTGA